MMKTTTISRSTVSILALAVSLGLGSAAMAGEGNHGDKEHHADDARAHAQHHGERAGMDARNTLEQRLGEERGAQLTQSFRQLDRDNDGMLMIDELDASERNQLARFDADDDGRLDRYEYRFANSARFMDLDSDNDGSLDRDELEPAKPEWVSFVALDVDNDRQLSRQEYEQFIESGDWVRNSDRYAFDYMDTDRSGGVDRNEAALYLPLASEFTAYDQDGDGLIDRTQYELFLQRVDAEQQRANRVAGTDEEPTERQEY